MGLGVVDISQNHKNEDFPDLWEVKVKKLLVPHESE